jgi:hypothetical protein
MYRVVPPDAGGAGGAGLLTAGRLGAVKGAGEVGAAAGSEKGTVPIGLITHGFAQA